MFNDQPMHERNDINDLTRQEACHGLPSHPALVEETGLLWPSLQVVKGSPAWVTQEAVRLQAAPGALLTGAAADALLSEAAVGVLAAEEMEAAAALTQTT